MPRVSVIIPSYNHEKFIREAIQSVLNQSYHDFEIVIVDDGSTDNSVFEIGMFSDPRIKLIEFRKNQGACAAANTCIENSQGEFIAMLSSDDVFLPKKLEKQVEFLDRNLEYGAVLGFPNFIDEKGNNYVDSDNFFNKVFKIENKNRYSWLNWFFFNGNCLCHPSAMIRKDCYDKIGKYDERYSGLPDYDFWIRMCFHYEIYILQENLVDFRIRNNEENASGRRIDNRIRNNVELLNILKNYLNINDVEEFFNIFPEVKAIDNIQNIESSLIPFFLAQLALKTENTIHHLFGIEILFEQLKSRSQSELIKSKLGFTFSDFTKIRSSYDPFNIGKDEIIRELLNLKSVKLHRKIEEVIRILKMN